MNFTEAIRKSNLAKEEVLKTREDIAKTREIAEAIKAALIEQGAEINDIDFENIAQYIKDNKIGAGTPWERPKEWLTLPKVVAEDGVYTNILKGRKENFNFNKIEDITVLPEGVTYLDSFVEEISNLSKITTGMKDGTFKVSANDFAYEMLCKVKENEDNLLLFEGLTYSLYGNIPFTQLALSQSAYFLTDLFIQIDDEEPLNLTKLAKGEIELPTEGKYKNIAIVNNDSLIWESTSEDYSSLNMIMKNIHKSKDENGCNTISLLLSLDYNCFDDDTKMKNGDKQCIVKIWGNGFIRLLPARAWSGLSSVLNDNNIPMNVRVNDCIIDVTVCDSNIDALLFLASYYYKNENRTQRNQIDYMPLTLETLYLGFGDNTQNITFISNLEVNEVVEAYFSDSFLGKTQRLNAIEDDTSLTFWVSNPYDFNFYMDLKQIDCSNVKYYNSYYNMIVFLLSTPIVLNRDIHSMTAKLKNVENIIFPDFKKDIREGYYILNYKNYQRITPYYLNLSAFKSLTRECILDLIEKLPVLNLDLTVDNYESKVNVFSLRLDDEVTNVISFLNYEFNNDGSTTMYKPTEILTEDSTCTYREQIEKVFDIPGCLQCFNGDKKLVEKFLFRNLGYDNKESDSLGIRINLDTQCSRPYTFNEDTFIDKKFFHSLLLSTSVFDKLTIEDIQLAKDKGWRIVKGTNHFMQTLYPTVEDR